MRPPLMLAFGACLAIVLPGCAKTTVGQVQELDSGTYSIGVSKTSGIVSDSNKPLSDAVDKAGGFCHAKGLKFLLKNATGSTVVFRCVQGDAVSQ